jgi:UDP-2,3-diacylglucosamine pyrophosphatase LpxH
MPANQGWELGAVRTVFISDVHLGSRHAQGTALLQFLEEVRPESLYLVGDIIDGWELRRRARWSETCTRILAQLSDMAASGVRLYYTPGNHDAFLRDRTALKFITDRFDFVEIADEFVFEAADGRRLLVTHGDYFDVFETSAKWVSMALGFFYNKCLSANRWLSLLLRRKDKSPYQLCATGKRLVKRFVRFLSRFEGSLIDHARRQGCDGVVCGHLHTPKIVERDGMVYCNTGDWVEHCTALVEAGDGTLSLVQFYGTAELSVCRPRGTSENRAVTPARTNASPALDAASRLTVGTSSELCKEGNEENDRWQLTGSRVPVST